MAVLRGKRSRTTGAIRRPRRSQYTAEDARALGKLSELFDGINAKLLRVARDNELEHLSRNGFLQVSPACYRRLQQISPASIDRVRTRYGLGLLPRVKRGRNKAQQSVFAALPRVRACRSPCAGSIPMRRSESR